MSLIRVPLLVLVLLLAGVVGADDEKKADKPDPQTQKLRDEFGLARLNFLKQVIKDAEVSDATRDALIKVCDDAREDILAAVDQEKAQPGEDEDRKQIIADLNQKFTDGAAAVTNRDVAIEKAIAQQVSRLTYELELIRKGQLVEKMSDLDLTEEQKSAIEEIVSDTKKKVKSKAADEVMRDEQAVAAMLDARKKVHEKLHDEQKDPWKAYVNSHANEKRAPARFNSRP
jgi:hypothetical protein